MTRRTEVGGRYDLQTGAEIQSPVIRIVWVSNAYTCRP